MEHLFPSAVRVERMALTVVDGRPTMDWAQATDPDVEINRQLQYTKCRLDLNFVRPGKDIPQAVNAGKAPDRIGVGFFSPSAPIKAGDRIVAIPSDSGFIVVPGTFSIKVIPDVAQDYSEGHHIEVQIVETNQQLDDLFPDDDDEDLP